MGAGCILFTACIFNLTNKMLKKTFFTLLIIYCNSSFSQETRLSDHNNINWISYTGLFKINQRVSLHTEYQWRSVNGIKNTQQGLIRTGLNFTLNKDINLNAGYAFVETFPYGDYPNLYNFPEHRIYEQALIKNNIGILGLTHRLTLEQRFVGKINYINSKKTIDYVFLNRFRYRIRSELGINHKELSQKNTWSIALQDELFIGWGKNIGTNIFDQNRIAILLGYRINPMIKIEAGYINQTIQQPKRVNNWAVFQYNNGIAVNAIIAIDFTK